MRRLALVGLALAMAVYCALHLDLGTDITNFLPDRRSADLAALSTRLADSELTRTMVLCVGAPTTEAAIAAARALAARLATDPEVAWIRSGLDPDLLERLYEVYFPRRYYFLSAHPERDLAARLTAAALAERALEVRHDLAGPAAPLLKRLATADPLGAFRDIAARIQGQQSRLRLVDGHFVSEDGAFAILFVHGRSSAFDSRPQTRLLAHIDRSFAAVAAEHPGLVLEQSGVGRFAAAAEAAIKQDVYLIGACSFLGVAALFLLFLRSPLRFATASLPALGGILTATTVGLLWGGELDGLTLAFGASLIGIAIDYPIHLMVHHDLAAGVPAAVTARRLRGSLVLAALTTIASFAGLVATSFPGFREIGAFAIVGIATALLLTLVVLPGLLTAPRRVPPISAAVAHRLGVVVAALGRWRRWLLVVPLACALLAPLLLPRLRWVDDLSSLMRADPTLEAEDRRVRQRVSQLDPGRFVIGTASDETAAVALSDRIAERLETATRTGVVAGVQSLHALLWSADLQRRNWQALTAEPALAARVERAFTQAGFRTGALAPFRETLATPPPPPLTIADLQTTPLADVLRSLVFHLDDRVAVVAYLRDLHDPERLRALLGDLENVHLFEQRRFINRIYGEFRVTTLRQILLGTLLVAVVLLVRYRRWRPAVAAFLPSVLVALILLSAFAVLDVPTNLLHAVSLILVMGMGVDYGIFMVDCARQRQGLEATMLSLLVSCLTTVFVFGALALSSHAALHAIGTTTGAGILLSLLLAPVSLVIAGVGEEGDDAS